MPIVPKYTKQISLQTPGVQMSVAAPVRLEQAYVNSYTRSGQLIDSAIKTFFPKEDDDRQNRVPKAGSARASAEKDSLPLRTQLSAAARGELEQNGSLSASALDKFAAKHFTPQDASGPAGRDYSVLRFAAQAAQQSEALLAAKASVREEESLIRRVGSLVRGSQALEEYLSGQLSAYQDRLARTGAKEEEVRSRTDRLRSQTVRDNISRTLSAGDWKSAADTLETHGTSLPEEVRRSCAEKTRASYARSAGEKLWRGAEGGTLQERLRSAQAQVREPDKELASLIRREIDVLARRERLGEYRQTAEDLARVCALDAVSARAFWDGRNTPCAEEFKQVSEAVMRLDADAVRTDAELFMRLYAGLNAAENSRAFKKGKVSARDFVRLEAARCQTQADTPDRETELVLRAADVWMHKKGFAEQDVANVQHALLCDRGSVLETWKEIKNYLEV